MKTDRTRRSLGDLDLQRFGRALAGPGMDTRAWVRAGVAAADAASQTFQDAAGNDVVLWFVDVTYEDGIGPVTCRMGTGDEVRPIKQGEEVLVIQPRGDPNSGPYVVAKPTNLGNPPPVGWANDQVVVSSKYPVRIVSSDVSVGAPVDARNPGKNTQPANQMILGTDYRNAEQQEHNSEESAYEALITAMAAANTAAGVMATAATTMATAATTWAGVPLSAPTYATAAAAGMTAMSTGATAIGAAMQAIQAAAQALLQALQTFEQAAGNDQNFLSGSGRVGK